MNKTETRFDGNSELVAELVTANGYKAAFAVKDGAEGPRGWQVPTLCSACIHFYHVFIIYILYAKCHHLLVIYCRSVIFPGLLPRRDSVWTLVSYLG
jgi:hypothetical protein